MPPAGAPGSPGGRGRCRPPRTSYDPIASQGIYKALVDADDASRTIVAALGQGQAPPAPFDDRVRGRFDDYLANRNYLYGLEQRWPDADFWRDRSVRAGFIR